MQDKRGYVPDVDVEASHRRQGLGQQLMALAETAFARRGIGFAILLATAAGQPRYAALYAGLGRRQSIEMAGPVGALAAEIGRPRHYVQAASQYNLDIDIVIHIAHSVFTYVVSPGVMCGIMSLSGRRVILEEL